VHLWIAVLLWAYGMKAKADPLAFLLDLNHQLAPAEKASTAIIDRCLRPACGRRASSITIDCTRPPALGA
jgi:hypothetical protein